MTSLVQAPPNPFGREVLNNPRDFVPEWDVPSHGREATASLLAAIRGMDAGALEVDPNRKIRVLLGPPGYGKTHLFGRLAHALGREVVNVFVPPIQDIRRPLHHIRHHVVMCVFDVPVGGRSPIAEALAALCRASFLKYLAALPRPLDARYEPLRGRLQTDGRAIWEIVEAVKTFQPFRMLGDSLAHAFPDLNGPVVRALALGWSPEHDAARRWLRGEALPEEQAARLGFPDDPPDPIEVLKAVCTLMAGHAPVVLCIDQLDVLFADPEQAPLKFSNDVMTLRVNVPNLLIVLGCLEVEWREMERKFAGAFKDRTEAYKLGLLTEPQGMELIHRRLQSWHGGPERRAEWWPLDEGSLRRLLQAEPVRARTLLKTCEAAYRDWAEAGDFGLLIDLKRVSNGGVDLPRHFREEWDKEMAAVARDKGRSIENAQDARLARAIEEGLALLPRMPHGLHGGVVPKAIRKDVVAQAANPDPYRYTIEAMLLGTKGGEAIILALEVNHSATKFVHYHKAVMDLVGKSAAGAVFLTPKARVSAGPRTWTAMEGEMKRRQIRTISLTDHRGDFERLECFLMLLDRASMQDLQLAGRTITPEECRKMAAKAGVLANLGLFDQMLGGWVTAPAPAPVLAPVAVATVPKADDRETAPVATAAQEPPKSEAVVAVQPLPERETQGPKGPAPETLSGERVEWAANGQDLIERRLGELGARVRTRGIVQIGPTFARFLFTPYPATTINKVRNRAEDLKIGLEDVDSLPIISSESGAISIDVQLPERFRRSVRLADVGKGPPGAAAFPVGQDVAGVSHWLDFADANLCHLLVAGTTGSGKSEFLKAMIAALARNLGPGRVKFALIDPKQVTFNFGDRTGPFLLRPVANGAEDALALVKECFAEVERRYTQLKAKNLEDLAGWQAIDPKAPPRLILVFDEFADLMADRDAKKELETPLKRIGAQARAAGIHLVLATQRPEATVVTPLLRSNLPGRVCLRVASAADSNLILKTPDGADLLGRGDLLWQRGAGNVRLQSPFVDGGELEAALFPSTK